MSIIPPIPSGPWTGIHFVGGGGGSPFSTVGWVNNTKAYTVKGLDVWYNSGALRGIQVTYSDNSRSAVFGAADNKHGSITFASGELVTSMTLWGNGIGTRTGRIRLTTNKGQNFDVGKDTSGQTAYDINVGSGYLVGMVGRSGNDIDLLAAIFLRSRVWRVSIKDITYIPNLVGTDHGITPVALNQTYFANPASANKPLGWTFGGTTARKAGTSYEETTGNTYTTSASVEVSGEIFGIGASASAGFAWERTASRTTGLHFEDEVSFSWSLSGELQPGESTVCTALVQRGEVRLEYTAIVSVMLEDGTTNTYRERGVFNTVAYSKVSAQQEPSKRHAGHAVGSELVMVEL